jgi:hypothetical protein
MVIIETSIFTKLIQELICDESYLELQSNLVNNPAMGDLIPGGGGLRKVRWKSDTKGKRGGLRIIYYWLVRDEQILMLYVYAKSKQDNLSKSQLVLLREIVERWKDEKKEV